MKKSEDKADVVIRDETSETMELEFSIDVAQRTTEGTGFAALCSQLGDALLVGDDLETMMKVLLDRAFELTAAQRGSICLYDEKSHELTPVISRRGPAAVPINISRTITEQVLQQKTALLVMDAGSDNQLGAAESIAAMNIQSVICAPLYHSGLVKGLIYLDMVASESGFLKDNQFEEEDLELLISIAVFAAVCVEKAQLLERINQETKQRLQVANRIRVMLDVAKSLASELDTDVLINKIMHSARELLQAERCTLFLLDREKEELWSKVADGDFEIRIPMTQGIAGEAATLGKSLNIPDAYQHPSFSPEADKKTGFLTKNILCMPVRNNDGTIIGVTQMINKIGGPFTSVDEELLEAFSAQTAVALENALLFQQTLEMRIYLESVLKSITNLVITLDEEGRMVTANHPVEPFLGVNEKILIKKAYSEWYKGTNDDFIADIRRVLDPQSQPIYVADYELEHKDKTISLNYNIVPLLDFENAQKGAVLVLENISQQKRVMGTLTRHLGSGVAQQLLEGEENRLGGVRQEVTILFSDIRGYTTMGESLDANLIVTMLNEYFSLMVDEIFAENGVLDKYIGDALMAVFGVPFPSETDAVHACRCALRMMKALDVFNDRLQSQNRPPISIGIGINSGEAISGNIGSEKRLEYTCIGDTVNLASRLEGASKTYGVPIILQESTKLAIGDGFFVRELDLIQVKGKQQPARIYELLGSKEHPMSPELADALPHFESGLMAYRNQDFTTASQHFKKSLAITNDSPSQLFLDRCKLLKNQCPKPDWDGVWEMTTK